MRPMQKINKGGDYPPFCKRGLLKSLFIVLLKRVRSHLPFVSVSPVGTLGLGGCGASGSANFPGYQAIGDTNRSHQDLDTLTEVHAGISIK